MWDVGCWVFRGRCFPVSRAQFDRHAQRLEPAAEGLEMLLCQDLRWRHERHIEPAFQGHQRGTRGDDRLAGTHVALEQSAHRLRAAQIAADFAQNPGLGGGERKTKLFEKGLDQMIVAGAGKSFRVGLEFLAPTLDRQLELEELIIRQTPPRGFHVGQLFRKMEHADGLSTRRAGNRA